MEHRHASELRHMSDQMELLQYQLMRMEDKLDQATRSWYQKLWTWLNRPITLGGRELSIEITDEIHEDDPRVKGKKRSGMKRLTDTKVA